jgi:hypothetical protein
VEAGAAYFGSSGGFDYISQPLPTVLGTTYQISYDLATSATGPGPIEDQNEFVANYGGTVQTTQAGTTLLDSPNYIVGGNTFNDTTFTEVTPSYVNYTWNFTATSSSTNLNFGGFNGPQYFFLDHVSVTEIPEPAQWGLPAVVGLAALLASRRLQSKLLAAVATSAPRPDRDRVM